MHDPMIVTFEIRSPIPRIRKMTPKMAAAYPRVSLRGPFWRIAGREIYWRALITVWHVESNGADAGTVCRPSTWKRHPHHWKIQVHPMQRARRWLFQRCAWCNGPSRRGDYVNISEGWEHDHAKHWWQSDPGVYHRDCQTIAEAHRTCTCTIAKGGPWTNGTRVGHNRDILLPWGRCATCNGFRSHKAATDARFAKAQRRAVAILRRIPTGTRDATALAAVARLWRQYRAEEKIRAATASKEDQ
ncbi:hypothetical protein AB0870_08250 [Microbacterium proteolyticum]|uniref:hypothetical protein n=1 Tax=Microbacterium proteolyticum TaxID=1572644 RepID=UPI00345B597D